VVLDEVEHEVAGLHGLEALVAERARELRRERGVLVHEDGEARGAVGCGLDHHRLCSFPSAGEIERLREMARPASASCGSPPRRC
jgi:hypothetical protein